MASAPAHGRTARAGKEGTSVLFAGPADLRKIKTLEKRVKKNFIKGELPKADQVREKQLFRAVRNVQETIPDKNKIGKILPEAHASLDYLSREELINRVLMMEYNRMPEVSKGDIKELDMSKSFSKDRGGGDPNKVKLFLNLGKYDGLNKKKLVSYLSGQSGVDEREISIVELNNSFSLLRVKKGLANPMISGFKDVSLGDRKVHLEVRKQKGFGGRRNGSDRSNSQGYKRRKSRSKKQRN